ncbi:MAG: Hsp70 family protein [Polyangiaceae bacterium]|nr:Hsp70 family protein [Polyangiaceae bacterium]
MKLGIDFGTTRTVVAAAVQGRYAIASFQTRDGYVEYLPGVVGLKDGKLLLGVEAATVLAGSERVVRSLKRSASRVPHTAPPEELGGAPWPSLELVTEFLRFVRHTIIEGSNLDVPRGEPLEAMVAVPAHATTRQRFLTLEAFKRAGFVVLGLLNEPTAAAVEFARRHLGILNRRSPKRFLVVYDLGGGTFDSAAVSLEGRRFELLTSAGLPDVGGDDIDEILLDLALAAADERRLFHPTIRVALLQVCQEAKEALTPGSKRLLIDLGRAVPDLEPVVIDTTELYGRCAPLVERTVQTTREVLDQLRAWGIDPENPREVGAIYLVGGGSAFPPVVRRLRELFGRKVELAIQPHAATAIGLAVTADPDADIFLRERVTRHFGVWRDAYSGTEQRFDLLLSRGDGTYVGDAVVVERRYTSRHAVGNLRFVECSKLSRTGEPAGDLTPWGEVFFPYDVVLRDESDVARLQLACAERRPGDEIAEEYRYLRDGSVSVTLQNLSHGYSRTYRLGDL